MFIKSNQYNHPQVPKRKKNKPCIHNIGLFFQFKAEYQINI